MSSPRRTVIDVVDRRAASRIMVGIAGETLQSLNGTIERAVGGSWPAVQSYVRAYQGITSGVLEAVHELRPDLVAVVDGQHRIGDANGHFSRAPVAVLERTSIDAPFSPWIGIAGESDGIALEALSRTRELLIGVAPLPLPRRKAASPAWNVDELAVRRFARLVMQELDGDQPPLQRVSETFALNTTELGRLFGVTRQAAAQWLEQGVPSQRQAKVATVAAIADILDRRLKRSRVPGVVRRPAHAYNGKNMLELIEGDRHEWLLESVRESFDYAATA